MGINMKINTWNFPGKGPLAAGLAALLCLSCGTDRAAPAAETPAPEAALGGGGEAPGLEEIAELERTGRYIPGMALAESAIRENAGDYGGAVIAAYKELAWAYGHGMAVRAELEEGLGRLLELYGEAGEGEHEPPGKGRDTTRAARGILAFIAGHWEAAAELLDCFAGEEPDAFSRWMLLVCALEGGDRGRNTRSGYGAIRARYDSFPEYWYRGARSFPAPFAAEYAERCINLSPAGPFAEECRGIIARGLGISGPEGAAIRSKAEIEEIITRSTAEGRPEVLAELFPLIALPDNAYTIYALGALRALAADPRFRDFFSGQGALAGGRLAERLAYAARG
jgi:hypothetical protein